MEIFQQLLGIANNYWYIFLCFSDAYQQEMEFTMVPIDNPKVRLNFAHSLKSKKSCPIEENCTELH